MRVQNACYQHSGMFSLYLIATSPLVQNAGFVDPKKSPQVWFFNNSKD